jgi:hypothetical protein
VFFFGLVKGIGTLLQRLSYCVIHGGELGVY